MRGIDPRTSCMQSQRSTIWATSPYLSHAKRALYHLRYIPVLFKLGASFWTKFMKYLFPFVTSCQFLPIFTNKKKQNSRILKNFFGDAGHRSSYLSHAKRALYHLSYIPVMISLRASFSTQFLKNRFSICNEVSNHSHYQQEQTRIVESSKMFWDARQLSPYLLHAKRALYHLSYIPVLFKLQASFWNKFIKYQFSICNEVSNHSHYQQKQTRIVESSKMFWRCEASNPVPLAC